MLLEQEQQHLGIVFPDDKPDNSGDVIIMLEEDLASFFSRSEDDDMSL